LAGKVPAKKAISIIINRMINMDGQENCNKVKPVSPSIFSFWIIVRSERKLGHNLMGGV
jgi:hypothetical protein